MKSYQKLRAFLSKPENIIVVGLSIILIYLILVPLFSVVNDTFTVHSSELGRIRGAETGDYTSYHWKGIFAGKKAKKIVPKHFGTILSKVRKENYSADSK